MKYILLSGLMLFSALAADAQKNNFFGDIGMSGGGDYPGASFTYSRKVTKHLGLGAGIQGYDRKTTDWYLKTKHQFIPAAFVDVRVYMPVKKRSLIFLIGDVGMNFYKSNGTGNYEMPHSNGIYTGLGFGYFYRVTKRGLGPYISFKLNGDTYMAKQANPVTNETSRVFSMDAQPVLSLGVKF